MSKYLIEGGFPLRGEVTIQRAKNAAQKILSATIAFPGSYILHSLSRIQDTAALIKILRFLGARVTFPAAYRARHYQRNPARDYRDVNGYLLV